MKDLIFKGAAVAMVTPFKDNNEIDYEELNRLIDFNIENGTNAIVITGTTGESSTLSDEEHKKAIKHTVEYVNKRIPVIAGTGSNDTEYAVQLSQYAESVGVDGLLIVTPYYNKATQKGLIEHYTYIADRVNTPIILYNVPSRTGCNIKPDTAVKIVSDNENIVGIKEASGNIDQVRKIYELSKDKDVNIDIYSGNDEDVISVLQNGGIGVISVCANIVPKRTHDMVYKYIDGDALTAKKMQQEQTELSEVLFSEVNPIPIKEACYLKGLINDNSLRMPLSNIEDDNKKRLVKVLKKQGLI